MLSQENIDRLDFDGIYISEPILSVLPSYKRNNPYHCTNWVFRPRKYKDKYYMVDTYWSTKNFTIELTNNNFDKFTKLFNIKEVEKIPSFDHFLYYKEEDRFKVAMDSGGWHYPKYFVKKGAMPNKEYVIEIYEDKIKQAESHLNFLLYRLKQIEDGEIDLRCVIL